MLVDQGKSEFYRKFLLQKTIAFGISDDEVEV